MVCKKKVTLRHQTLQFQHHLHSSCQCHGKSVIQVLLYSFMFCRLVNTNNSWWFVVFAAVSKVSSFEAGNDTDNLVSARWENNNCMLHCNVLMQLVLEWKWSVKNTAKLIYPNRNWMVWYLAVSTHSHTLGPLYSIGGGGGGGLLAVKVFGNVHF